MTSYCYLVEIHCRSLNSVIPPTQGFVQGMNTFPLQITRADGKQQNQKCIPCNRNTNLTNFAFRNITQFKFPSKLSVYSDPPLSRRPHRMI